MFLKVTRHLNFRRALVLILAQFAIEIGIDASAVASRVGTAMVVETVGDYARIKESRGVQARHCLNIKNIDRELSSYAPPVCIEGENVSYLAEAFTINWFDRVLPFQRISPRGSQVQKDKAERLNEIIRTARKRVAGRIREIRMHCEEGAPLSQVEHLRSFVGNRNLVIELSCKLTTKKDFEKHLENALRYVAEVELKADEQKKRFKKEFKLSEAFMRVPLECASVKNPEARESCQAGMTLEWMDFVAHLGGFEGASARYGCTQVNIGRRSVALTNLDLGEQLDADVQESELECLLPASEFNCMRNGKKTGRWKEYCHTNGVCDEGEYRDGVRVGRWKEYCGPDGVCSEGEYKDGTKSGRWKQNCRETGICDEGEYIDGEKFGLWSEFCSAGGSCAVGEYKHNRRDGRWIFDCNSEGGCSRGEYKNGGMVGVWRFCNKNGECREKEVGVEDGSERNIDLIP